MSHIKSARGSQDLRSPAPIKAPDIGEVIDIFTGEDMARKIPATGVRIRFRMNFMSDVFFSKTLVFTDVSTKVVLQKRRSIRDNSDWYYG